MVKEIPLLIFQIMVGRRVPPELIMDDELLYLTSLKEAFHDEPAKYAEFVNMLNDSRAERYELFSPCYI